MDLAVDDLRLYINCSAAWFYARRAGIARPRTANSLVAQSLSTGLELHYTGRADSLSAAVGQVWRSWCDTWGEPTVFAELMRYAHDRAAILAQFEKGAFRKADGGLYTAPKMTAKFRELMHTRGLTAQGRKLDEFGAQRGLQWDDTDGEPGGRVGGAMADAFADAVTAAEQMTHHQSEPLPGKEVVLGLQIPYVVQLSPILRLTGVADVVRQAPSGPDAVVLEVHDCESQPFMRATQAARDLRVLAAALAQPGSADLTWARVERVIYRHWLGGETYAFQECNSGHLLAVVAAAARGLQHQVVSPRALVGYDACRACDYRLQCWSESGWESLLLLDPGRLQVAERTRLIIRQVQAAVGQDGEVGRRLSQALTALEAEFTRLDPNLAGMLTLAQAVQAATGETP